MLGWLTHDYAMKVAAEAVQAAGAFIPDDQKCELFGLVYDQAKLLLTEFDERSARSRRRVKPQTD